jgi:mannose-6-phosphate isomerase-like protein (cupin superfamily)
MTKLSLDFETGSFKFDASEILARDRLEAHHRDAQIWIVRIGSGYVRRFGRRTKISL